MIAAAIIKAKRSAAGIPGSILCKRIGIARSRLSDIERGYVTARPEELLRIESALEQLIQDKNAIEDVAASLGWPWRRGNGET